jgi:hypothetical protein
MIFATIWPAARTSMESCGGSPAVLSRVGFVLRRAPLSRGLGQRRMPLSVTAVDPTCNKPCLPWLSHIRVGGGASMVFLHELEINVSESPAAGS